MLHLFSEMKQLTLIREKKYRARKTARLISLKCANHVVFKASKPVLRKNASLVRNIVRKAQDRFGFKLRALAVMEDHIHLVICVHSRVQFANAIRFLAGQLALKIARGKLWSTLAWSRVLRWGRSLRVAEFYVWNNPFKAGVARAVVDSAFILNGVLQVWEGKDFSVNIQ